MDELRKTLREKVDRLVDDIVTLTVREGNRMAVVRLREARARAKGNGSREGRIPFGEHPHYPKEKDALEFMLGMAKRGSTIRSIAEAMERQGFVTRHGSQSWNPGSVIRILKRHGAK